jgi:hypothetical protein
MISAMTASYLVRGNVAECLRASAAIRTKWLEV